MTWRQIQRAYALAGQRRNRERADLIEAVAVAWGGKPAETIEKLRNPHRSP